VPSFKYAVYFSMASVSRTLRYERFLLSEAGAGLITFFQKNWDIPVWGLVRIPGMRVILRSGGRCPVNVGQ
jgi:hypothetical protein